MEVLKAEPSAWTLAKTRLESRLGEENAQKLEEKLKEWLESELAAVNLRCEGLEKRLDALQSQDVIPKTPTKEEEVVTKYTNNSHRVALNSAARQHGSRKKKGDDPQAPQDFDSLKHGKPITPEHMDVPFHSPSAPTTDDDEEVGHEGKGESAFGARMSTAAKTSMTVVSHGLKHLPSQMEHMGDVDVEKANLASLTKGRPDMSIHCEYDREFQESIWDAMYFWDMAGMSRFHSAFIMVGFILTIFSQVMFCVAILNGGRDNSAFLSDQYPSLDDIKKWRMNSGHNVQTLDTLSGMSMVSRVCNEDKSLPFSNNYQTLRSDLNTYLDGNIGSMLCSAAIFVWGLTVMQNLEPVSSAFLSVAFIKGSHITMIAKSDAPQYRFKFVSMATWRRCLVFLIFSIRAGVSIITGITGALWLSNTKNLQNLILNVSALSLILYVDELVYATCLPRKLRSLLESAEPLKLPDKLIGGVLQTAIEVLCIVSFTLYYITQKVLPDNSWLQQKEEALCGGNVDFVYTRHHTTNTLYASSTHKEAKVLGDYYHSSINDLMNHDDGVLASDVIQITPNYGKVILVHSESMTQYTKAFMNYSPLCVDSNDDNFQMRTVRYLTQSSETATCAEMVHDCSGPQGNLLRLLCPRTCGCDHPGSGMMFRVLSEGCPRKTCQTSEHYQKILDQGECKDITLAESKQSKEWNKYFSILAHWPWDTKYKAAVQHVAHHMLETGCPGIPYALTHYLHFNFCVATEASAARPGIASLRYFCPVTCQCKTMEFPYDCPTSCNNTHFHAH